jgi:lipopolysaccharide export system permease protein
MAFLVQASVGNLPTEFIFHLLILRLLGDLMLILPLCFFLAVLLALGRLYKDNEVTAMAACGIPVPTSSIIGFGAIFSLVIGLLSLMLAPWAESQRAILQVKLSSVAEVGGIAAGRFKEFRHGNGIFYVKTIDPDNDTMHSLFVQLNLDHGKRVVMVAKRGYQTVQNGELYMVLVDGHRYESKETQVDYVITQFAEHQIRIPKSLDAPQDAKRDAIPTLMLVSAKDAALQAELQWRLSLPLSVILLAALAVPLSRTNPRQGQYAKILSGILIYLIYNNLLNVAKKWVERGDVVPIIGVWWVHIILLLIILFLFNLSFFQSVFQKLWGAFYSFIKMPFLFLRLKKHNR